MCVRYGEDPSSHSKYNLDLWLDVETTGNPDRNRICGISMTIARDIRLGSSVLTINTIQFGLSQPSSVVEELVEQRVSALRAEMEAKYEEQKKTNKGDQGILFQSLSSPLQTSTIFSSPSPSPSPSI